MSKAQILMQILDFVNDLIGNFSKSDFTDQDFEDMKARRDSLNQKMKNLDVPTTPQE